MLFFSPHLDVQRSLRWVVLFRRARLKAAAQTGRRAEGEKRQEEERRRKRRDQMGFYRSIAPDSISTQEVEEMKCIALFREREGERETERDKREEEKKSVG